MKQIVAIRPGEVAIIDIERPVCAADTVLLKTLYSGISNGTERNQILGNNYNSGRRYPFGLGYQSVSEVVEVGREITRFAPGDRVITGVSQTHVEYYLVRETDLICKLPSDFDLEAGALLSVAAVALHDVRRAEVTQSDKVLVCGGGVLGNCAMQHARQTGAQTWLLNRSEPRARMADQLGATGIIWGDMDAIQTGLTELKPFDVVIETTGNDDLLQLLVGQGWGQGVFRSRGRGRLVMIGGKFDICYNSNAAQSAELSILHAAHYVQDDLDETVRRAADGRLKLRPLVQDVVPLHEAPAIYQTLVHSPGRLLGTVIQWP